MGSDINITMNEKYHIHRFAAVDSTMDELKRLIVKLPETPEFTVILAKTQQSGRGRRGKVWVSDEGNLYFSIYLRPNCLLSQATQINFVASLALVDLLEEYHLKPKLKWPNDVLVQGQKVSGILMESDADSSAHVKWILLGVGLNVFHAPDNLPYPATYIAKITKKEHDLDVLLSKFLSYFTARYNQWLENGFERLRADWLAHSAHELGSKITIQSDKKIVGTFETLTESGALQIRSLNEAKHIMTIHAGDVLLNV